MYCFGNYYFYLCLFVCNQLIFTGIVFVYFNSMRRKQPIYYNSIKRGNYYYIAKVSTASGRVLKIYRGTKSKEDITETYFNLFLNYLI